MSLNVCAHCTTKFSIGAEHCPQCGNADFYEEGSMPKIRRDGGATYPIGVIPPGAELVEVDVVLDADQAEAIAAGAPFVVETVEDDGPDDAPDGPYAALLRADLQALCTERGLPSSGTKAELIARLAADDAAKAEQAEPE